LHSLKTLRDPSYFLNCARLHRTLLLLLLLLGKKSARDFRI
jgi:hypothetical protein